ncbi:MAG TPA: hypothetical protein VKT81_03730 [Bryobacteraceae bacterium]|nr:hypothetical protein [Bryobacteraceae bacterium]
MKRKRHTSMSALLEEILQAVRREQHKLAFDKAVGAHYDSLTQEESEEQAEWGKFALREFPA